MRIVVDAVDDAVVVFLVVDDVIDVWNTENASEDRIDDDDESPRTIIAAAVITTGPVEVLMVRLFCVYCVDGQVLYRSSVSLLWCSVVVDNTTSRWDLMRFVAAVSMMIEEEEKEMNGGTTEKNVTLQFYYVCPK